MGDPTMKGILDINREKEIIDKILKNNQIYDQFMIKKIIQQKRFQKNKEFVIDMPVEEDPNIKDKNNRNQNLDNSYD